MGFIRTRKQYVWGKMLVLKWKVEIKNDWSSPAEMHFRLSKKKNYHPHIIIIPKRLPRRPGF